MKSVLGLPICLSLLAMAGMAQADPKQLQTGASLGYAFPAGNLERGSRVSDETFGLTQLRIDGAYRVHSSWFAGLAFGYGFAIPKLCASSSDCSSSLGHDLTLGALGRWRSIAWRAFEPSLDVQLGYEWFGSKLSDTGTTSSRSYRGWYAAIGAFGALRVSSRWTLGPTFETSGGVFGRVALDAPGVSTSHPTDGDSLHIWIALGARAVAEW